MTTGEPGTPERPLTVDDLLDALGELIDEDEFFEDEDEDDGE